MKNAKHIIALFYVTLILLFKVSGMHAFTHHTDDVDVEHCEVCHITTTVNFIPLLETDSPTLPKAEYYFLEQKFNAGVPFIAFSNNHVSGYLFTRPPPQFL